MRCPHCGNEIQDAPISKAGQTAKKWLLWSMLLIGVGAVGLNTHNLAADIVTALGIGLVWKFGTGYLEALR